LNADIRARFLPRFTKIAVERVDRAFTLLERSNWNALVGEFHALAGEAALLELADIAKLAHDGEKTARAAATTADCERILNAIRAQIAAIPA
jgi:HPt (histidine-containing phosphotransfer) domain-containing protein